MWFSIIGNLLYIILVFVFCNFGERCHVSAFLVIKRIIAQVSIHIFVRWNNRDMNMAAQTILGILGSGVSQSGADSYLIFPLEATKTFLSSFSRSKNRTAQLKRHPKWPKIFMSFTAWGRDYYTDCSGGLCSEWQGLFTSGTWISFHN